MAQPSRNGNCTGLAFESFFAASSAFSHKRPNPTDRETPKFPTNTRDLRSNACQYWGRRRRPFALPVNRWIPWAPEVERWALQGRKLWPVLTGVRAFALPADSDTANGTSSVANRPAAAASFFFFFFFGVVDRMKINLKFFDIHFRSNWPSKRWGGPIMKRPMLHGIRLLASAGRHD